ncbi:hypothetical protein E8E12_009392 [Didymella heteroderae]|uniref:Uncharacterized protein n=1 Tax=Didymella heteroderae TaxID=1769908 RepID=A0A9P4WTK6_9PLEO|nr:hypothetical protein E8E12_009392 [Didymella heteroderae]
MGFEARPPLPAPTEPSTLSSADHEDIPLRDDVDTNVSARTDKTSYSIPEDGTPITINTTHPTATKTSLHKKYPSQTSLLIEYFEAGKENGKTRSRPSVRVRVTPSSRKKNRHGVDQVHLTQTTTKHSAKPAYTRRISLQQNSPAATHTHTHTHAHAHTQDHSDGSTVSSLPPVDIEVLNHASDLSSDRHFVPMAMTSDISSMPADSMLEGTPQILVPERRRSRSLERDTVLTDSNVAESSELLKAPKHQRSRSMSKDRITQRVMEKLQQQQQAQAETSSSRTRRTEKTGRDELSSPRKSSRRHSKDVRGEEISTISGTDSSLLSSNADRKSAVPSVRSGVSTTSSINNPKLLATVEDAIRRLILPELNALKEENRTSKNRDKFERMSRDSGATYETVETTSSRDPSTSRRRVSKSSSTPNITGSKPKVVVDRDDKPFEIVSDKSSRKERRSSRGSTSDRTERSFADSTSKTATRENSHKRRSGRAAREAEIAALAGSGLTAAALKKHTSREEAAEDRKHKKKHSSRSSHSRSASVAESMEQEELAKDVPPLPFIQSELHGSELTRDSILSAETETKNRSRSTSKSSTTTGAETPLREVPRGFAASGPHTPTRTTPTALQRTIGTSHGNHSIEDIRLKSPMSDRSYGSRSRGVGSASLEAAAAAKARAIERSETQASHYEIIGTTPTRGLSPIQSEASYREDVHTTGSPRHLRTSQSAASVSSLGRQVERQPSNLSIGTLESTASTKAARTRKRPQGVNLESVRSTMGSPQTPKTPRDAELFFEQNHEQNEMYRRELEESSQLSENYPVNYNRLTNYTDDSEGVQYLDHEQKVDLTQQDIRRVGASPEYVHTPLAVESAVASLHEPSSISVRSSAVSSPLREPISSPLKKSRLSQVSPAPSQDRILHIEEHEIPSGERWGALRDKAEAMAYQQHPQDNSPRQSIAQSIDEQPEMHHSAFPVQDHMMPEIGYGLDNESEISTNPSIIQGPLNGGDGYYDRTEDYEQRDHASTRQSSKQSFNKGAALGAGAGAAAVAAAAAHHLNNRSPSIDEQHQATVEDDYESYTGDSFVGHEGHHDYAQSNRTPLSGTTGWRDEGYQSANQREGYTPQNRNHSKVFDDEFADDYDETPLGGEDMFASNAKHGRQFSGNSHGMASPLYDAATGKGIDHIQSKDIVALMDHLTVRDAQRNARDTEILVTLVRSAAEMRNQLDELKGFIKVQDNMIMNTTDKRVDVAEQRILGGPRPQPQSFGSSRGARSASDDLEAEAKKKNVFKRALKGLSMKGDSDIKNIEAMLMQLLGDVEGLKQVQQLQLEQSNRTNSLTSYENLRASGDPGYEPEGRANTDNSPNQSGYLSNPASSSRRINDLHSGYDVVQTNRISTVHEDDEEYLEREPRYENTERMTTPTQDAYHSRSLSQEKASPQAARTSQSQSQEDTPKKNKHKSNSSSIFGIPKISRWSKTTSSTEPRNSVEKRPYSSHSRSSSQKSFDSYDDEYSANGDRAADDRSLRSRESRDDRSFRSSVRSPSPLIPEDPYEQEDPKYHAHRNSLNLQHPQPRAGPTGRHQNHLETEAQLYIPDNVSGVSGISGSGVQSPDYDQWGSMPSLARNRMSAGGNSNNYNAGNLSPISSDGGYSGHSASEQTGRLAQQQQMPQQKVVDDGPLIPPNGGVLAGYGQARSMYSSPNEFGSQGVLTPLAPIAEVRYSLETDRGHYRGSPTPSPRPSSAHLRASAQQSPQRKPTGPRPMGARSPAPAASPLRQSQQQYSQDLSRDDTVIRRRPVSHADTESLLSYTTSRDGSDDGRSETF